ncbi:MAG: hypothetical protein M3385_09410 [Actinomycetota bacterium]|jgi:hypothetical protein|nr:hypothetical protein [Actinomycetota bacterium]
MPDRITSAGDGVDSVADTHESRIFKKLGLHSRTQLTVWVTNRGLPPSILR